MGITYPLFKISSWLLCVSLYETWAKFVKDEFGFDKGIKVVRKEHHDWWSGEEHIKIYKLQNDSLKLVEEKVVNF